MQEMMQTDVGLGERLWASSQCLTHLITGGFQGVDGVAVAALAPGAAGDVPRIGSTAVAVLTDHVLFAGTLAAVLVTLTLIRGGTGLRCCAHRVTHALCTEEKKHVNQQVLALKCAAQFISRA